MKRSGRDHEGQATIEFTLTLILLLAFVFFFVQLALVMGWANYIQYATYMTARSFASAGPDRGEMDARARKVLDQTIRPGGRERLPFLARDNAAGEVGLGIPIRDDGYADGNRESSWREGVRYSFKSKLFLLPMGKSELPGDERYLQLKSEAWLSREPADGECKEQMESGNKAGVPFYFDNGC